MRSAVEAAITTYIQAWTEPDPAARASMLERCWAAEGRLVTMGREVRGRAALAELMAAFFPRLQRIRLLSVLDIGASTFRFRGAADLRDGTSAESFDAGEFEADGRM